MYAVNDVRSRRWSQNMLNSADYRRIDYSDNMFQIIRLRNLYIRVEFVVLSSSICFIFLDIKKYYILRNKSKILNSYFFSDRLRLTLLTLLASTATPVGQGRGFQSLRNCKHNVVASEDVVEGRTHEPSLAAVGYFAIFRNSEITKPCKVSWRQFIEKETIHDNSIFNLFSITHYATGLKDLV